jgi:hypothetical protein
MAFAQTNKFINTILRKYISSKGYPTTIHLQDFLVTYQSLFNAIVSKSKNAPITYAHAYNKQLQGGKKPPKGVPHHSQKKTIIKDFPLSFDCMLIIPRPSLCSALLCARISSPFTNVWVPPLL